MSPVEGWYPDPAGNPSLERFWDGAMWTSNTRPIGEESVPPAPAPVEPLASLAPDPGDPGVTIAPTPDVLPPAPTAAAFAPEATPEASPEALPEAFPEALPPAPAPDPMPSMDPGSAPGPAPVPAMAGTPMPPSGGPGPAGAGVGIAGISTDLLTDPRFAEVQTSDRVSRQNSRLLKVLLGQDVLARQGSMVAYQGQVDFNFEGSGAAKFIKKAVSGEGLSLMRCSGQGELFLADSGYQVHIIHLEGAGLTVNGKNVLAFEPSLSWDIERIKGGGMLAGGLFNTRLEGHGWVAITTDGDPVVLRTNQPTFVDTDAVVAWSSSLTTSLNRTVKSQALIGRGSGEAVQLTFQGDGIVIVQPSEGSNVPPHTH